MPIYRAGIYGPDGFVAHIYHRAESVEEANEYFQDNVVLGPVIYSVLYPEEVPWVGY